MEKGGNKGKTKRKHGETKGRKGEPKGNTGETVGNRRNTRGKKGKQGETGVLGDPSCRTTIKFTQSHNYTQQRTVLQESGGHQLKRWFPTNLPVASTSPLPHRLTSTTHATTSQGSHLCYFMVLVLDWTCTSRPWPCYRFPSSTNFPAPKQAQCPRRSRGFCFFLPLLCAQFHSISFTFPLFLPVSSQICSC